MSWGAAWRRRHAHRASCPYNKALRCRRSAHGDPGLHLTQTDARLDTYRRLRAVDPDAFVDVLTRKDVQVRVGGQMKMVTMIMDDGDNGGRALVLGSGPGLGLAAAGGGGRAST